MQPLDARHVSAHPSALYLQAAKGRNLIFKMQDSTTPKCLEAELPGVALVALTRGALLPRFRCLNSADGRLWKPFGWLSADAK